MTVRRSSDVGYEPLGGTIIERLAGLFEAEN